VGVFASAPWKKGSRGGGAEGKTKPASAVLILQEAADGIPRALAMTDGRVVQGAAEAWRGFLPLEHRVGELERRQRTRFFIECRENFDE